MGELEEKLNAVLSDPNMMQQLMSAAQALGASSAPKNESQPDIDLGMIQKMSGFASAGKIDKDQQALLRALGPYLSRERISKLEKAMRAARMAKLATGLINSGALQF